MVLEVGLWRLGALLRGILSHCLIFKSKGDLVGEGKMQKKARVGNLRFWITLYLLILIPIVSHAGRRWVIHYFCLYFILLLFSVIKNVSSSTYNKKNPSFRLYENFRIIGFVIFNFFYKLNLRSYGQLLSLLSIRICCITLQTRNKN